MTGANLDQIFIHYVGGCGRYQLINTILMSFVYHTSLIVIFISVFTAYAPKHRCRVDVCDDQNTTKVRLYPPIR